jgi:hypothetical protein
MTPIQASPTLSLSNDYLSTFLSNAQEKTSAVKLSEVKVLAEKHAPKITAFFPMRAVSFMIGSSELGALKISFESLADHTEALSKTGFSAKQIIGILGRSGPHIAERADNLIKFTQPPVNCHGQAVHLPSDLEYLLNAGLSHDHISNMLFGSQGHLSENMAALREFVTPSILRTNAQGQPILYSPLHMLENAGLFKDNISRIFRKFTHNLAFGINHLLYLTYAPQNTPFNQVFQEEEAVYKSEMSDADEVTQEDANDILEILGTGKISRNSSEESFLLRDVAEATMEDANDLLEIFGTDKSNEKKINQHEEPFLLGDTDSLLLDDRDYISEMFNADLDLRI